MNESNPIVSTVINVGVPLDILRNRQISEYVRKLSNYWFAKKWKKFCTYLDHEPWRWSCKSINKWQ